MDICVRDAVVRIGVKDASTLLAEMERRLIWGEGFAVATLNLDHLVKLRDDERFRKAYARHDLVTADGNPIVWLSRLAGAPLTLTTGSDSLGAVLHLAARIGMPVGFLGSTEAVLATAAARFRGWIPDLDLRMAIAPSMGFDPEGPEARAALDRLAAGGVRLVIVALGAPRQERFAALGRALQPALGFMGVGAALDFVAEAQPRAPLWMRRLALEWLWRALRDPRRLARRYWLCALILPGLAAQVAAGRLRTRVARRARA